MESIQPPDENVIDLSQRKVWNRFMLASSRWLWKLRQLLTVGLPDARVGSGESLPRDSRESKIRIAPGRKGEPIASFWSIWSQGDEIYVAARSHTGSFKLSLHSSGRWFSTFGPKRDRLAPAWPLPGGNWRHALELRFLVGEGALPPAPSGRFRPSSPGYTMEVPPGEFLTVQLLIGSHGTTHDTPIPVNWNWPKLLQLTLRDGTCAVLVAATFPIDARMRQQLEALRSLRLQSSKPADARSTHLELFQVAVTSTNIITVVPQGLESFTSKPTPPGRRQFKVRRLPTGKR